MFGRELQTRFGDRISVLNGEGALLWIHEGGELVCEAPSGRGMETATKSIHCYGSAWAFAPEGYEVVVHSLPLLKGLRVVIGGWASSLYRRVRVGWGAISNP
jgi:hypothetical protein